MGYVDDKRLQNGFRVLVVGNNLAVWIVTFWPNYDHVICVLNTESGSNYLHGRLLRHHNFRLCDRSARDSFLDKVLDLFIFPTNSHDPVCAGLY